MTSWYIIPIIVFLILFSAFFSGSEITFAHANKMRVRKAAEDGKRSAKAALYISENFTKSLSTILVGNNLVNIAASSAATVLCVEVFGAKSGPGIATMGMTILLVIFGETLPKIIAAEFADQLVCVVARPLRLLMTLFKPITSATAALVDRISFLWTKKEPAPTVTPEELVEIVDAIEDEGVLTEREGELIKSAIEFSDVTARDIMTPRVDVRGIDIEESIDEILADEETLEYSRFPVFRETLDNVIGILSRRKLLHMAAEVAESESGVFNIEPLLKEPVYVHMTKNISDILLELREKHAHMAIVLDEFGGMAGILTMEDIIEEIVGEIYDESDEVEQVVFRVGEDRVIVDGTMQLEELFELLDYRPENFDSEYVTVNGWVTELLDHFPEKGETVEFERISMTVMGVKQMCAERVEVSLKPEEEDE